MSNRLDNYFREHLRDHQTTPSPSAWEKVEARISKKNNADTLLKIAAAIGLIGLISVLLINREPDNTMPRITEKKNIHNQASPKAEAPKKHEEASSNSHVTKSMTPRTSATFRHKKPIQLPQPEINIHLEATPDQQPVVMESIEPEQVATSDSQDKPKTKRIVIVYTLPTINKPAADNTVTAEDKRTGLQKVMDVAMEVRASDSPLGQLREAKDDLFALEFKKDKNKTKN